MKKNMLFLKLSYLLFAFCILVFGAMSFFMHKDILLIPTFVAFVGLSAISSIRSRLEGDHKSFLLFMGASLLFIVITVVTWRHMGLVPEDFRHIF